MILLVDPADPEPFWNRLAAVRWPAEPDAFDRRPTEMLVLFASLGRQPHVWPAPLGDSPADLADRLRANGFQSVGDGLVMSLVDPVAAGGTDAAPHPGATLERLAGLRGAAARAAADDMLAVLVDAFDVAAGREPAFHAETVEALDHPWFTYYLVRLDGRPAAGGRRATFDGLSCLTSIGTASWARGNGFGRLVTQAATADAVASGSEWTYLGVFADNDVAIRLYEGLGFRQIGAPCLDLILV